MSQSGESEWTSTETTCAVEAATSTCGLLSDRRFSSVFIDVVLRYDMFRCIVIRIESKMKQTHAFTLIALWPAELCVSINIMINFIKRGRGTLKRRA